MLAKLRAYAELLRLSNSLTVVADVWCGLILCRGTLEPAGVTVLLTLASLLMYHAGMVLNDFADAGVDAQERPTRPIPSGRVAAPAALRLSVGMLAVGGLLAAVAVELNGGSRAGLLIIVALIVAIVAYNVRLKSTACGPWAMGACRALNLLLGMSMAPIPVWLLFTAAAGMLLYVAGVTLFARDEAAATTPRHGLVPAMVIAATGLAAFAFGPFATGEIGWPHVDALRWFTLWAVVAMLIGRRFAAAALQPHPKQIQSAVGNAIQSIILIDAALAWGYGGPFWSLAILALWPPTMLMARFIPPT